MEYIKGLNGLRAIAVILVVISHWFPATHILNIMPIGKIGVDVFFVLSGFLISRILLFQKKTVDNSVYQKVKIIKNFVFRRTLRIFPIYYLLLFLMYFIEGDNFKKSLFYYLTYLSNILFYKTQDWHGAFAHLWSLAVEEQFYLVWPLLLMFTLAKHQVKLFLILIVVSLLYLSCNDNYMSFILTVSCLHSLVMGALLAYIEVYKPSYSILFKKCLNFIFFPLVMLFFFNFLIFKFMWFPTRLIVSLITLNLINICLLNNKKNYIFYILDTKVLNFIGLISYGIYLYHYPLFGYWNEIIKPLGISFPSFGFYVNYLELLIQFLFLIVFSYVSWILIEKPILELKKYF